jgi:hypothetical protein
LEYCIVPTTVLVLEWLASYSSSLISGVGRGGGEAQP